MSSIQKICVFCGSSEGQQEIFLQTATQLGHYIGQGDFSLVYGGAKIGLMGAVADAAIAEGGAVIGVMPEHLKAKEIAHGGLTELHITDTMQQRQKMMADLSDAFIILPGGLGTLAEFFEIVTFKQLGLHNKPIIILNIGGYWDGLISMINRMVEQGFMRGQPDQLFIVLDEISALDNLLKSH